MTAARGPMLGRRHFTVMLAASYSDGVRGRDDVASVVIREFTFLPGKLVIAAGQTVEWTNQDDVPHSIIHAAHPHGFKSRVLFQGERWWFRFDVPGRYAYFCGMYRHMQGVVLVG